MIWFKCGRPLKSSCIIPYAICRAFGCVLHYAFSYHHPSLCCGLVYLGRRCCWSSGAGSNAGDLLCPDVPSSIPSAMPMAVPLTIPSAITIPPLLWFGISGTAMLLVEWRWFKCGRPLLSRCAIQYSICRAFGCALDYAFGYHQPPFVVVWYMWDGDAAGRVALVQVRETSWIQLCHPVRHPP